MVFGTHLCLSLLTIAFGAYAETPIGKVISLLEELRTEVESEGKTEAKSYDSYACFCKTATEDKSSIAKKSKDDIDSLSASIADMTQSKKDASTELGERKTKQEKLATELDETIARCAKEKAAYEVEDADLSKAISSLEAATKALKDSRPSAAVLLAIKSSIAKVLTGRSTNQMAMAALLQRKAAVDPNDPAYSFHSNDIVELCEHLLEEFRDDKSEADAEWGKTQKACAETEDSLKKEIKSNKDAMDQLSKDIERFTSDIASARENLITAQSDLQDSELYLKDLTAQCEARAHDYDQRSNERGDELDALSSALDILTNKVKLAASEEDRALLQEPAGEEKQQDSKKAILSFLQVVPVKEHKPSFLERSVATLDARKHLALSILQAEGRRIGSMTISSFVSRASADPFKKVKALIQRLIERLLEESKNEATKKGFCDESLGRAEHDREQHFQEAKDLSREVKGLKAKRDELEEEIDMLTKLLDKDGTLFKKTTEDREAEKAENLAAIETAKKGMEAVTEALQVLKSYYSQAAKATVLIQASPVDEDTSGPGFSSAYKGKQGGMKAIFGLLEVIVSDFDRTVRKTEEAEEAAHRDYVKFMQITKMDEGSMSTKKELDHQDLKTTNTKIEKKMADLQATMDLLDKALQEIEQLKPTCIDTGMSYDERVQKREDEMKALRNALCILDTDKVESECV